ncbi:MAG TPA: hypothetical protein VNU20_00665 [Candidatus Sulfotelmatobacter sp.]|jgi:hypothetical protein|nr:hypothetical protein [Candidatus Sulfotelmatobacter sp.]
MGGLFLDIFIEYLFRIFLRAVRLFRSRNWPVINATVLSAGCPQSGLGCTVANVDYEYAVDGVKYAESFEKPFLSLDAGMGYAQQFVKGTEFRVRVHPVDPSRSVAAPQDWS